MFADISSFGKTDTEFADFLVKNEGVATVPGTSFYEQNKTDNAGKKYVRFSFSQKLETIKEAIERIKTRIENI